MYEMRRHKPEPTLLLTDGIVKLPHHIGMLSEELAFDDTVGAAQLNVMAVAGFITRLNDAKRVLITDFTIPINHFKYERPYLISF